MQASARWRILSLDELMQSGAVRLGRGKVISKTDLAETPGTFPVYSSAREGDGKFGEYGKYLFDEELITWSVDGGGRLFHRLKHKFSVTNVGGFLRVLRKDLISYRFLYYALTLEHSRVRFDWVKKAHPSTLRKEYKNIPLPSLSEQKRIVTLLDEAFEGIDAAAANTENNLTNARKLLSEVHRSEFQTLSFSSKIVTLGSICDFENGDRGKNYPGKEHRVASGIAFINAGHLTKGGIDHASMDFISQERFDLLGNGKIKPKDILFCLRGSIGKFSSVEGLAVGAIASSLVILRPKASLIHEYLLEYLASDLCHAMIEKMKGGAAQPNLGAKDLGKFALPLPCLAEQGRVLRRLRQIRAETKRLEATYLRKLLALHSLKQAMLRKAFAGELTAQPESILQEAAE